MNPLNIIDSIYSGESYPETKKMRIERSVDNNFSASRFPLSIDIVSCPNLTITPYQIHFSEYDSILSRTKLSLTPAPVFLSLSSRRLDWDMVITSYSKSGATLSEPLGINSSELFYNYEDSRSLYLSPLGVLAILFRRSYGNEKFKQYVNSTLLRDDYYKISAKNSPTFYVYKNSKVTMDSIKDVGELFKTDRWRIISDMLIMSPYVFSWRD